MDKKVSKILNIVENKKEGEEENESKLYNYHEIPPLHPKKKEKEKEKKKTLLNRTVQPTNISWKEVEGRRTKMKRRVKKSGI